MSFPLYPKNQAMPVLPYQMYLTSPYCANNGSVNCGDPYSILIYAILTLGEQNPSINSFTADEITTIIPQICSDIAWDLTTTSLYISKAYKRGILTTVNGPTYFAINARMGLVNPINLKYFCVGQLYKC